MQPVEIGADARAVEIVDVDIDAEIVVLPDVAQVERIVEAHGVVGHAVAAEPFRAAASQLSQGMLDLAPRDAGERLDVGLRKVVPKVGGEHPDGRDGARIARHDEPRHVADAQQLAGHHAARAAEGHEGERTDVEARAIRIERIALFMLAVTTRRMPSAASAMSIPSGSAMRSRIARSAASRSSAISPARK